jgi:hypothetical protein
VQMGDEIRQITPILSTAEELSPRSVMAAWQP